MADRGQMVAAVCPPRARLALTTQRAGWLEEERALLPSARALPSFTLPCLPLSQPQRTADATSSAELARARRGATASTIQTVAPPSPHGPRQCPHGASRAVGERHCRTVHHRGMAAMVAAGDLTRSRLTASP